MNDVMDCRQGDLNFFTPEQARLLGFGDPPSDPGAYRTVRDHVLAGSHGGQHVLLGPAKLAVVNDRVQCVIVDEQTRVSHADRHLDMTLPAGTWIVPRMRDADGLVED